MNTKSLKSDLVTQIMELEDITTLQRIAAMLKHENKIQQLAKPIRKKLDLEQLKKEQNFQTIDKEKLFAQMDKLALKEPLEVLLKMI